MLNTGIKIDGVEIVEGTKLTSDSIYFNSESDITRDSGNYVVVEYKPDYAAFVLVKYTSKGKRLNMKLFSDFLVGWKPSVFQVKIV